MKANVTRIEIDGESYPIRIDNYVLQEIQESYGSIIQFEKDIVGLKDKIGEDGEYELDENGRRKQIVVETSLNALNFIIPIMIEEGLSITGERKENFDAKEVLQNMDIPFEVQAEIVRSEFARCFSSKKHRPKKVEMKKS